MSEEEEDVQDPEPPTMDAEEQEDESEDRARQTDHEEGVEPDRWQHSWDWESVMEGSQGLAYDPRSDSDATMTGVECPWGTASSPPTRGPATLCMPGSPMETLEVHVNEAELEDL